MKDTMNTATVNCTYSSSEARCYLGNVASSTPNCNANSDGNVYCNDGSDYCGVYGTGGKWYAYCRQNGS